MSGCSKENRMIHFDVLRILAAFSVVMLHSSAQFWYTLEVDSTQWVIANSYNAVFRFGVPIFVMISGALFLAPDYRLDVKRLYKHNILRLCAIYAVWSCVYGWKDCLGFGLKITDVKPILREMLSGRYHLWFLPMIVGIYMLLPVLKSWITHAEKKNIQYFLGLFVVLQVGKETLRALTVTDELHGILNLVQIEMVCSYVGYFVLGYYLAHVGIGEKLRKAIYISVLPAMVCNIVFGTLMVQKYGRGGYLVYDSYGLFTFFIVTALFLFTVKNIPGSNMGKAGQAVIKEISADTMGIYVMHICLMELTENTGLQSMMLPNIIGIPVYAIACFVICMIFAALLRRIPLIGKYIC